MVKHGLLSYDSYLKFCTFAPLLTGKMVFDRELKNQADIHERFI